MRAIILRMVNSFVFIACGSLVAMYVFGLIFERQPWMFVENVLAIVLIAALCTLTYLIFYSKKELDRTKIFVRCIIQSICVFGIVLVVGIFMDWFSFREPLQIIALALIVFVMYIIAITIELISSKKLVNKLNRKLEEREKEKM